MCPSVPVQPDYIHPSLFVNMVRISVLNDALNSIVNAERKGKRQVLIRPSSKVVIKFLSVMQRHGELIVDSIKRNRRHLEEAEWF